MTEDVQLLSPAAQAEIDRRVEEKMEQMLATLQGAASSPMTLSSDSAMTALLESFAQNMAAISSQANGKTVVPPAIKKAREEGANRMMALIDQAAVDVAAGAEAPKYGLHKTIQLNTHDGPILLDPVWQNEVTKKAEETVFIWPSIPCDAMRPLNAIASAIFEAFRQSNTNVEGLGLRERSIGVTAKGRVVFGDVVHRREEIKLGAQFDRDDMNVTPGFQMLSGANHLQRSVHRKVLGSTADPFVESAI